MPDTNTGKSGACTMQVRCSTGGKKWTLTGHYENDKMIAWRNGDMAKKKPKNTFIEIDYSTE
ncbi:MAG: hypothetical protein GX625_18585, partial [Clostridiaceae bacterium]|nr:hypothetical protein [Clostridiaceae bacterium]